MKFVQVLGMVLAAALLIVGSVAAIGAGQSFAYASTQLPVQPPTSQLDTSFVPPGAFPESDGDLSNGENLDIALLPDLSRSNSIMIWGVSGDAESREEFGNQVAGALGLVAPRDFSVSIDSYGDYSADPWGFERSLRGGFDEGFEDGTTGLDPDVGTFDVEISLSKMLGNVNNGERRIEIDTAALTRVARIHGYTSASISYCPIFGTVSYAGSSVEPQVEEDGCAKWTLNVSRTSTPLMVSIIEFGSADGMRNLFIAAAGIAGVLFALGALGLFVVRATGALKTVGRASLVWIISLALLGSTVWMLGVGIVLISDIGSKIALTSERPGLSLLTASLVPTVLPGVAVAMLGLILAFGKPPVRQLRDQVVGAGPLAPRTDVAGQPRRGVTASDRPASTQQVPARPDQIEKQSESTGDATPGGSTGDWTPPR